MFSSASIAQAPSAALTKLRARRSFSQLTAALGLLCQIACAPQPSPAPSHPRPAPSNEDRPSQPNAYAGVRLHPVDSSVEPCNDFYQHACGAWLAEAKLPPHRLWVDQTGEALSKNRREIISEILNAAHDQNKQPPAARAMSEALTRTYRSCVEAPQPEQSRRALGPSLKALAKLEAARPELPDEERLARLLEAIGALHRVGVPALFNLSVSPSSTPANHSFEEIKQAGSTEQAKEAAPSAGFIWRLSLSPIGSPLKLAPSSKQRALAVQAELATSLAQLNQSWVELGLLPHASSEHTWLELARSIYELEARLDNLYDGNHETSRQRLSPGATQPLSLIPTAHWRAYLKGLFAQNEPSARPNSNSQPSALETPPQISAALAWPRLTQLLLTEPLPHWRSYLSWQLILHARLLLPDALAEPLYRLAPRPGERAIIPRRDRCIFWMETAFAQEFGAYFERHAPSSAEQAQLRELIRALKRSYHTQLAGATWADPATREAASQWLDQLAFQTSPASPTIPRENSEQFPEIWLKRSRALALRPSIDAAMPVRREELRLPPTLANLFYLPSLHAISIPPGYLLSPNALAESPLEARFARAGFGVAHEMAHAFDGRATSPLFTAESSSPTQPQHWLSPANVQAFNQRLSCFSDLSRTSSPDTGLVALNPAQKPWPEAKRAELIADQLGLSVAYNAFKGAQANHTANSGQGSPAALSAAQQRRAFWLHYAQAHCRKANSEGEAWLRASDVHGLHHARVNLNLRGQAGFQEDFGCVAPQPMAEAHMCSLR